MIRNLLVSIVTVAVWVAFAVPALAGDSSSEQEVLLRVQDQSCLACTSSVTTLMKISREVRGIQGVHKTKMNLAQHQVLVIYDADVTSSTELGIRLTELGYHATRYDKSLGTSLAKK